MEGFSCDRAYCGCKLNMQFRTTEKIPDDQPRAWFVDAAEQLGLPRVVGSVLGGTGFRAIGQEKNWQS